MSTPKKSLGQHWLQDSQTLEAITESAEISQTDTVLEIGPGLGFLTNYLLPKAAHVIAVEKDEALARHLTSKSLSKLSVVSGDILQFNLSELPTGYKVVANIPYYLTSNLLRVLSESSNPPKQMVLLVQKEVAQRICARPGQMSLLSVSVQLYYNVKLGLVVPAGMFEPPPKVDSQIVILKRHNKPLFKGLDIRIFFKLVKSGFSARRKKISGSLSGGLGLPKQDVLKLLSKAGINQDLRAQNLSLQDWHSLYLAYLDA